MKTKILFLAVAIFLALCICVGGFFLWPSQNKVITFDDGTKLTFLGVTYGRHHVPPKDKIRPGEQRQSFDTGNSALVVWVRQEHDRNHWPNYQLYLYDKAGVACVGDSGRRNNYGGNTNEIVGVEFDAFPRRQGKFILKVSEWNQNGGGQTMNETHWTISNPMRDRSFPKWTAENLPSTKTDGDLSVTLTKLVFGAAGNFSSRSDDADDASSKGVEAIFHAQQNGTNAVNWQVTSIETSDATENHQSAGANAHWNGDDLVADYQWGLWPGEPWKLRVEFSKQSNFDDNELWVVKNIPVQPGLQRDFNDWNRNNRTNAPFAETDLNGMHFKLFSVRQFTDVPANSQPAGGFKYIVKPSPPPGMQINIVKITDDQSNDIENWNYGSSSGSNGVEYHQGLRDLEGVTNLIVTIAVHKNHFLEFTAQPETQVTQ